MIMMMMMIILLLDTATMTISIPVSIAVSFSSTRMISRTRETFRDKGVLVVMHPNLKNPSLNPNLTTKLLHHIIINFLHFPPQLLSKPLHFLSLLLAKFRPEPLPVRVHRPGPARLAQGQQHVWVVRRRDRRRRLRPTRGPDRWRVVPVMGAVLDHRRRRGVVCFPAVEVAVAAACGASEGGGVGG